MCIVTLFLSLFFYPDVQSCLAQCGTNALCFPVVSLAPRTAGRLVCRLRQTSLGVLVCPRPADAVLSQPFSYFFYTAPSHPPSYRHLLFKPSLLNFHHIRLLHMDKTCTTLHPYSSAIAISKYFHVIKWDLRWFGRTISQYTPS